jgi:hypothetical protein
MSAVGEKGYMPEDYTLEVGGFGLITVKIFTHLSLIFYALHKVSSAL